MRLKKAITLFIGMWGVLLIMCFVMDSQLTAVQQVGYTGAMSLVAPLLYIVSERVGAVKGKRYLVHRAGEEAVLCRVEGEWICPGTDERPTHYIRKGKVFAFAQKGALYIVKDATVCRAGEETPFLRVEGDKVYCTVSGELLYELREMEEAAKL